MKLPRAAETLVRVWHVFRLRLLAGLSWNLLSILSLQGSVLLTSVVVARMTGIEDFGVYALMLTTLLTVTGIAQGSSGVAATKFVAESLATEPQRVARVLRVCGVATAASGLFCAVLLWATAPQLADDLLRKPAVESHLRWVALAVVFQVLIAYQHGALQGFCAFRRLGLASGLAGLLHLVASVLGAAVNGLEGAVQGLVVAAIGRASIVSFALRKTLAEHGIQRTSGVSREDWRALWAFALPATLAGFVTLPALWAVTLLVARQPDGLAWTALFAVAHQIKQAVLQIPSLLNVVAFSALSRAKGQGDNASFRQIYLSGLALSFGFTTCVVAVVAALASEVLALFGSDFVSGVPLLRVLLLAAILEALASAAYQLVQSRGYMWHSLIIIALPRDAGYVALAVMGLALWGLVGAGGAYLVAQTAGLILTLLVIRLTGRGIDAPAR